MRKFCGFLAVLLVLLTACGAPQKGGADPLEETAAVLLEAVKTPTVSSIGGEWAVIGLTRWGGELPEGWADAYYANAVRCVESCGGVLHDKKYTEYSRVVLALTAIGKDPTDVAGYDLTAPLADFDRTVWQGINGPVWALIAMDSGNYEFAAAPEGAVQGSREAYLSYLLENRLPDGGWGLTPGGASDVDLTAMALQALAPYGDRADVAQAVDGALEWLSGRQGESGAYAACEATAQVLVALCELGIPLDDPRFVKNGATVRDGLMTFRLEEGGFRSRQGDEGMSLMSTEQAFYAMAAAMRAEQGLNSLYDMTDVMK